MHTKRVIPCLDVKDGRVVKGVNFVNFRDAGDPSEVASAYDAAGADEVVFLDITASADSRATKLEWVRKVASKVFIPFTVVGGIGIMNIMYVSVTERTREIGLRMSVGARGVDILSQFLIEAILISITGGLIGVIIGCGASFMIKAIAHWPVFIQPWSVLLSFLVCTVTGVFFGWYPAKKAADLDPIDALRYE